MVALGSSLTRTVTWRRDAAKFMGGLKVAAGGVELGEVYKKQGRYADALPLFQAALAVHEEASDVGSPLPQMAADHNNIAACLKNMGHRWEGRARCQG